MSKSNSVVLDDKQIYEIKKLVTETRQFLEFIQMFLLGMIFVSFWIKRIFCYVNILFQIRMEPIHTEILHGLRQIMTLLHLLA